MLPDVERAELRDGGALPPTFFNKESGVVLWPHNIDYKTGLEIANTIAIRPGDVPAFFGFPRSGNADEIKERTAEIVSVLGATLVHVVFIGDDDKNDGNGKKDVEYTHFRTFRDVIDWSRALAKVLSTRFINEVKLHNLDNVLVVVCKGQQLKVTEDECKDFKALIGLNPNGAPPESLHPFKSCYFLNHELSVDGSDIFASSVWDIIVGRLLLAFTLSREQENQNAMWTRPGIRIWKAEECHWDVAENTANRISDTALAKVKQNLKDAIVKPDAASALSEPYTTIPKDEVKADPDLDYVGAWNVFDPYELANRAVRSEERLDQIKKSAKSYFEWRRGNELRGERHEAEQIFGFVNEDASQIFARSKALDDALGASTAAGAESEKFKTLLGQMAETESRRRSLTNAIAGMANEMKLAQTHFVDKEEALFVIASVTSLFGVVLWQVVTLLGGSLITVLWLVAASALGALVAAAAIVATHSQAGNEAAKAYAATCRELDSTSAQRFNEARGILCEAVRRRLETRRRNARLVTSDLLERIKGVLLRELGYEKARVSQKAVARRVAGFSPFELGQRTEYLGCTRGDIKGSAASLRSDVMENNMVAAWNATSGISSFPELWRNFCNDFDKAKTGHLPASEFIPRMRAFMSDFAYLTRSSVNRELDESCAGYKAEKVRDWVGSSEKTGFYSARAAVNPKAEALKRLVFVAKDENPVFFNTVKEGVLTSDTEFFESQILASTDTPLAFAVHEVSVTLKSDTASNVLSIEQEDWEDE